MTLRQQYHFQQTSQGLLVWDVTKLIAKAATLSVKEVSLSCIQELDECFWYDAGGVKPTCRSVAEHAKLIFETDLQYPIILSSQGRVMDGMHRVCQALLKGLTTIKAVQFQELIPPDYIDVHPDDLPYEDA